MFVSHDYRKYQYYSERIFGILENFSPQLEIFSIDEAFVELASPNDSVAADYISSIVKDIKQSLFDQLGPVLTATIGVGHGKRLAKLAGEFKKPDGCVVLLNDSETELAQKFKKHGALSFLRHELYKQADIEELCGIGHTTGRRLRGNSVNTLADLAKLSLDELRALVFPYEKELFLVGKGQVPSPVISYRNQKAEQSIGHQYTLPRDIPVVDLPSVLFYLAEKVGYRLRKNGFVSHHLGVYLRKSKLPNGKFGGSWYAHQKTSQQIETDLDIYRRTWSLIEQSLNDPNGNLRAHELIRMPGIVVTELIKSPSAMQSIISDEQSSVTLTRAMDNIRQRYGNRSISSGLSVKTKLHHIPDGRRKRFNPINKQNQTSIFN